MNKMSASQTWWSRVRVGMTSAAVAVLLSACGGGGSGGSDNPSVPASSVGVLTDDPIAGVPYTTSSGASGTTDEQGRFNFVAGDTVTFNFGGVAIALAAETRITPVVIAEALFPGNPESQANAITNLSVLFQSLDSDGDRNDGRITVPTNTNLSITFQTNLQQALAKPPNDFGGDLAIEVQDEGGPARIILVDPTDALLKFYRNELMGAWQATKVVEAGQEITTGLDSRGFLMSFDRGCDESSPCDFGFGPLTLDEPGVSRFNWVAYDFQADSDDDRSATAVGSINYNANDRKFYIRGIVRPLRAGSPVSSTDPQDDLFDATVSFEGAQLVVSFPANDETPAAKVYFSRLNSVQNSLRGAWVEVEPPPSQNELQAMGLQSILPGPTNEDGPLSFPQSGAGIFYYFLSDSRVVVAFTDIDAEVCAEITCDEQNGVIILNYSFNASTRALTVLENRLDSVSIAPKVVFGPNDILPLGLTSNSDTEFSVDAGDDGTITFRRIVSLSESIGAFNRPVIPRR